VTALQGAAPQKIEATLTIQQASHLLNVPASTLRSWERRYDLPTTPRTPGGHRRYSSKELNELRLMRDEITRGKRPAAARLSVQRLLQQPEPARSMVAEFLAAAQAMDPARIRTCLDRATDNLGLGTTIDEVLLPAMRQIGWWWEIGTCDVAHEHLATEAARTWLGKVVAFAPDPRHPGSILLACGPRDWHSLGLEAFGTLLTRAGWQCRVLGAATPLAALLTAIRATGPAGVVVVSHLASGQRAAIQAIRAVAALDLPVFYAGNAFLTSPTRRRLPGTYLGDNHQDAVRRIETSLASKNGTPRRSSRHPNDQTP
jgi:MerR family transcriptional regulator, light-induced transcriptional regulator